MSDQSSQSESIRRKQSRPSRARGRAGQRAVEAVLEAANLIVQRVETENDIGRDAFVELVEGGDVTGGVISLQIKSGSSNFRNGHWVLPGTPEDFTLWLESSIPVFGVVHDPRSDELRWVNLGDAARAVGVNPGQITVGPFGKRAVVVPDANRLDLGVAPFVAAAIDSLRRSKGLPAAALMKRDEVIVEIGISDSFAIGRYDVNALLLLSALFHRLPQATRLSALRVLAMGTRHPDVFWTAENWISDAVKSAFCERACWHLVDVYALLSMIDEDGIDRGTVGQDVYHVLDIDRNLDRRLIEAISGPGADSSRFWATAILLYRSGDEAPSRLAYLLRLVPDLVEVENFEHIVASVDEFGYLSLF